MLHAMTALATAMDVLAQWSFRLGANKEKAIPSSWSEAGESILRQFRVPACASSKDAQ
jgi:hypothetical protein